MLERRALVLFSDHLDTLFRTLVGADTASLAVY